MTDEPHSPQQALSPPPSRLLPAAAYFLYLGSLILPFAAIVGVILAFIYRDDDQEWLQSHAQFQIRTFFIGLIAGIIGAVLFVILPIVAPFLGLGALLYAVWLLGRAINGLRYLNRYRAVPHPTSWWFGGL